MNEKIPLVSVGIATYNRPKGLNRTLECITGQTYTNLEIIVSDNCSPGNETYEVVMSYKLNDSRIKYFRQEKNFGMTNNGLFTLKQASGEYFLHANDDDEWYPDYIEKCVAVLKKDESIVLCATKGIMVSDRILMGENNNFSVNPQITPYFLIVDDFNTMNLPPIKRVKKFILKPNSALSAFGVYRTKIWKELNLKFTQKCHKFGADRFLLAHLNYLGSVYQIPEYLFVYHHGFGASCGNALTMNNEISKWQYYGLRINPLLTAYLNMIIDSFSWPVSITDHIRVIGYYLARMAKAKYLRYTMKTPFVGTPLYDYKPPEYPKR
jgi:Glycosyltransferases involved in cell wall biogenesis